MESIKKLYTKYNGLILYMAFGILTFLIDAGAFWLFSRLLDLKSSAVLLHVCSMVATLLAITFAYVTNRKYVFKSENRGKKAVLLEITEFYGARVFTMVLAEILMQIFVFGMGLGELITKIFVNVIVIILNYVFSKIFIFRKKER